MAASQDSGSGDCLNRRERSSQLSRHGLFFGILWLLSQSTGQSAYWDNMRGNADYHQGDYAAAASEYGQMIQINPQRQDGYSLQGMALTLPNPILYRNLGYVENGYGAPRQAIRDFNEALTLDLTIPDQPTETADARVRPRDC